MDESDLRRLYDLAVDSGDASALVRALCEHHGVSLPGLADASGIGYQTLYEWQRSERSPGRYTLLALRDLISPDAAARKRIASARNAHPFGRVGRPPKR